jgi:hypothetical protein
VRRCLLLAALTLSLAGVGGGTAAGAALIPLAPPATWTSSPVYATAPVDDPRLFVVERSGTVRIVKGGVVQPTPFLTVPNIDTVSERGLLSIAFTPDYAASGLLYAFYTAAGKDTLDPNGQLGDVRVVEYRRSAADPDRADPASARLVLKQTHPAGNHNGGWMAFGPDGLLYITIGDGATSANAQDLGNLLGKVLRIDPRGGQPYAIPPSNPFASRPPGARPEIFSLGLRNPFRASFAPDGRLVVGDVGESTWEEVDVGVAAGTNSGWPTCEGVCSDPRYSNPFFAYPHSGGPATTTGCAVIGGYVVRDPDLTGLTGRYLYGDLCAPDLRTLDLGIPGGDPRPAAMSLPAGALQSFGQDAGGCVYAVTSDTVYRVAPSAAAGAGCPRSTLPPAGGPGSTIPISSPRPAADKVRPKLHLKGGRQRLGRFVHVVARCNEPCAFGARGVLRFSKLARQADRAHGANGVSRSLRRIKPRRDHTHRRVELRLKLRSALLKRARKAVTGGRRVTAHVKVTAIDRAGNRTTHTVRARLTLPRR